MYCEYNFYGGILPYQVLKVKENNVFVLNTHTNHALKTNIYLHMQNERFI